MPIDITFRANREQEKQASQLISWSLSSGDSTFFAKNKTAKMWWEQGADIKVHFRWALGSMRRPVPSTLQPTLKIEGTTATLSYSGSWSLLKLLQAQNVQAADDAGDAQSVLIKFQVPTAPKDQTYPNTCDEDRIPPPEADELVVFMKMTLGDDALSKSFAIPRHFPFIAPTLSQLEASEQKRGFKQKQSQMCTIPKNPDGEDA